MFVEKIYADYYRRLEEWFEEDIGEKYEPARLQGYADAFNKLSADVEKMDYQTKENWRIESYRENELTSKAIRATIRIMAAERVASELTNLLIWIMLALAIGHIVLTGSFMVIIGPVAIMLLKALTNWLAIQAAHERFKGIYYYHGYNEGVISLVDDKNLHNVEEYLNTPLHL